MRQIWRIWLGCLGLHSVSREELLETFACMHAICDKCGVLLYEGMELKTPHEITESYDGKCPNCGRKLSYVPKKAEVKPVDEASQLR